MLNHTSKMLVQQQSTFMLLRPQQMLLPCQAMFFTGKTESGFKFKTPKLRMRVVRPVAAPGVNLKIPEGLTCEKFLAQIGGDCEEIADKFEEDEERPGGIKAVFSEDTIGFKNRGIPIQQRKYILSKFLSD